MGDLPSEVMTDTGVPTVVCGFSGNRSPVLGVVTANSEKQPVGRSNIGNLTREHQVDTYIDAGNLMRSSQEGNTSTCGECQADQQDITRFIRGDDRLRSIRSTIFQPVFKIQLQHEIHFNCGGLRSNGR